MKEYNDFKYACLFGGGAIRGAAHVGVIKALEEIGVEPTILAGSSVGSIIAALYAIGYTYQELSEIFMAVNFEIFRDLAFGFSPKFALSKGEVFLDWIRELIEKKFYGENYVKGEVEHVKFKDLNKNLVIITTDLKEFSCCEFSDFETPDFEIAMAVRISCCMPGLMKAVTQDDKLLVDGDLMKGKPMWILSKNLKAASDRILEIRLEGTYTGMDQNFLEYVNGMYTCMTHCETDFIKDTYTQKDKYDYLVIDTGSVVVVDFNYPSEKRQEIMDKGYDTTIRYFKEDLVKKKNKVLEIYDDILDNIRNIQGFIILGKYNNARNKTSELFINLAKTKDIIDEEVFNNITKLQELIFENVKYGLLGYCSCTNKNEIKDALNDIIDDLSGRIESIRKYISKFPV
jgi:NTE family protein